MTNQVRVMMIGLDGFELSIAERMMDEGRLPALQRLRGSGAHMVLDHGPWKRTGLAWEHVSSGLDPAGSGRWSAVDFDPRTYAVTQRPTVTTPFAAALPCRTVVFDPPYFDLGKAPGVRGLVNWGAHDPGVEQSARPGSLLDETMARFGPYPAKEHLYGFTWPSEERSEALGQGLIRAVELRSAMTEWLFAERLPDWELGFTVVSEYHSAIEALWHGVDPSHPLHSLPSAEPARRGLEGVYEAGDRMLGRMLDLFPDARFAVFNLHGMGANNADVADMALLPELLHRHSFGRAAMGQGSWPLTADGVPVITGSGTWEDEVDRVLPRGLRRPGPFRRALSSLHRRLRHRAGPESLSLDWMPGSRYRRFWPRMRAFALPSFYDGQIRINLKGREADGLVDPADHASDCDEIEILLRECRDAITGAPVVAAVERTPHPERLTGSQADLLVQWAGAPVGFVHPQLGTIGPLPYRRPGGHTGARGFAYFRGPGIQAGDYGTRSAFDVVPTVIELLLGSPALRTTGESFAGKIVWNRVAAGG